MSEYISSTLKIPVFDDKEKNFQIWMIRFQAYFQVKAFITALKISRYFPNSEEEIKTLDVTTANRKKKIAAGKKNVLEMAHITMALGTEMLLNKVNAVCYDEWPGEIAYKLIDLLK